MYRPARQPINPRPEQRIMPQRITQIPQLPPRAPDTHKGDFGRILLVGGSRGMIGAPALAANAALRSGAGLVRLAVPRGIQPTVAALAPCATSLPLAENEKGLITRSATKEVLNALTDNDVLALGPGLGCSNDLHTLVDRVVRDSALPMVIDADGLNNLAASPGSDLVLFANTVLTPHPGEMRRLWPRWFPTEELPASRIEQAQSLSERSGAVIVLKGAGTVVTDGDNTYVNTTGNPGMATGGAGDVLTGCLAALLALCGTTNFSVLDAAILATYVHGLAGDIAAAELTQTAMTATDLIDSLPRAWATLTPLAKNS